MAILAGGAMRVVDRKKKSATMADDYIGFLDLIWHGAHDGGEGSNREICARVALADETPASQIRVLLLLNAMPPRISQCFG